MPNETIKLAKRLHKKAKLNAEKFTQDRNTLIYQLANSRVPNWGGVRFTILKL